MIASNNQKDWNCFFGQMHVQKATFVIAFCYVCVLVTMLSALTVTWFKQERFKIDEEILLDFSILKGIHEEFEENEMSIVEVHEVMLSKKVYIFCFLTISVIGFVLVLIYGIIRKIPCCLLPFYSWQIFDLVISVICIVLYFRYIQFINSADNNFNYSNHQSLKLVDLSNKKYVLLTIAIFLSVILFKIYALIIVWRCFKYLADAKLKTEQSKDFRPPTFCVILANRFTYKPFEKKNVKTDLAIEFDNESMLNDSDTTIFLNEELLSKETGLGLM